MNHVKHVSGRTTPTTTKARGSAAAPTTQPHGHASFAPLNRGFASVFVPGQLSLGLVVPIEAYPIQPVPRLERHLERVRLAEELGFSAVWLRDIPFNVPSFGDAGQVLDPFVYLGALSVTTTTIALGVASIILPLRHPAHVAKAAASVDALSNGRLLLGVASGDRPAEYPALDIPFHERSARFRDAVEYIRAAAEQTPTFSNGYGTLRGDTDLLPKPTAGRLPLLITGGSRQSPDWVAKHGDGWMTYPRPPSAQTRIVDDYRQRVATVSTHDKPVTQSLYIDLDDDADAPPRPIHLGFRSGTRNLREHLQQLRTAGVNHVALNLRFNSSPVETAMRRIADDVLPMLD